MTGRQIDEGGVAERLPPSGRTRRAPALLTTILVLAWSLVLVAAPSRPAAAQGAPDATLTDVAQISAGRSSTCARLANGTAMCWGANAFGQLGDGTQVSRSRPGYVSDPAGTGPLTGVAAITVGGYHACARLTDGTVVCWGRNGSGQLGDGTGIDRLRPVVVSNATGSGPLTTVTSVTTGGNHSCARLTIGWVACWGSNTRGQLGVGSTVNLRRPTVVYDGAKVAPLLASEVSAGGDHTCAWLPGNRAACWGSNEDGELGIGSGGYRLRPVLVSTRAGTGPLANVAGVSAGEANTCARRTSGRAACWGRNSSGQVGDGTWTRRLRPVAVRNADNTGNLTTVAQMTMGGDVSCAHLAVGWVACWGRNTGGQLGVPSDDAARNLPALVRDAQGTGVLGDVQSIDSGGTALRTHTCAVLTNAVATCWGRNDRGQLGDGTTTDRSLPVLVSPADA